MFDTCLTGIRFAQIKQKPMKKKSFFRQRDVQIFKVGDKDKVVPLRSEIEEFL